MKEQIIIDEDILKEKGPDAEELSPSDNHQTKTADDDQTTETEEQSSTEESQPASRKKNLSTFQKIKNKASEDDSTPNGSKRFRDILGGDYLWMLARNQIWTIILVVLFITAYIAVRYQCQQDVIDISQLEKQLVDAKRKAMSSSSNLTKMCRKSNVLQVLKQNNDSTLHISQRPPYIINIPEE